MTTKVYSKQNLLIEAAAAALFGRGGGGKAIGEQRTKMEAVQVNQRVDEQRVANLRFGFMQICSKWRRRTVG